MPPTSSSETELSTQQLPLPGAPDADGQPAAEPRERPFLVGVGASAGGLEAIQKFVARLRPTGDLAFVLIQHLSPDFKSLMDELLTPHTALRVLRAEDGMQVQPDTIYLMPPKHEMTISGGRLCLTERDPGKGLFLPIDTFFRSLADDLGGRSIAIVLSGTGSDGSRGVRAVHEAGGLVVAQTQDSAKFDGMPRSAIDTGIVDLVLPPEEIAEALLRYAEHDGRLIPQEDDGEGRGVLERIFLLLQRECGIDFGDYKSGTVGRRIERRLLMSESLDLETYLRRIEGDPAELRSLYKDLLIGVTRFFRDADAFQRLRTEVIPPMVDRLLPGEEMRIWVPGCATGEEAYSLAMLAAEAFRERGRPANFRIFATDVHRASLEAGSAGRFPPASIVSIPPELRDLAFEQKNDVFQVRSELRERVVFAHHNVLRDAPFTRLDLLSCRNLLIYFKPQAQHRIFCLFHFALKSGGILQLGPSESPGALSDEFATIDARWKIFRKLRDVRLAPDLTIGGSPLSPTGRVRGQGRPTSEDPRVVKGRDTLLKQFLPPSIIVDDSFRILQSYNGVGEFLVPRDGDPSLNLLDLLDGELRVATAAALRRAQKEGGQVSLGAINALTHRGARRVRVVVCPVEETARPHESWVVAFQPDDRELPDLAEASRSADAEPDRPGLVDLFKDRVAMLENELRAARESLQTTVEEMETNNEELQATNEELIASNEELQSTNEELNSVNEELYTVNGEYQAKIAELTELTADMNNLLEATEVHTLFLDRELCVRKFTPKVAQTFNLIPQDVGRRFETFSHTLKENRLVEEVRKVLESGVIVEREVADQSGRMFFLRILPYRALQSVEGVVLTLIDISALRRAQEKLAASEERYRTLVRSITAILWTADAEGNFAIPQTEWEAYTGHGWNQHRGRGWLEAIHPEDREDLRESWDRAVADRQPFAAEGRLWNHARAAYRYFVARAAPLLGTDGKLKEWVGHIVDIHDSKGAELELRKKEEQIRAILERSPVFIYLKDFEGRYLLAGTECLAVLGRDCAEVVGKTDYELLPMALADQLRAAERRVFETGETVEEEIVLEVAGARRTFLVTRFPLRDDRNAIYAVAGIFTDITERKLAADEAQLAVQRRDRFLAMLSHELRTPLGAILNASSLLERLGTGDGGHERDIIKRQARHMAKLIEDLLDVGRITREQVVLDARLVDLRALLREVVDTERLSAERTSLKLDLYLPPEVICVKGDPVRLRQIFVNLISNCISYTPAGTVAVSLRRAGDTATVEVKDTGVGMTAEELSHVFEIFYQAPQTIDRPRGGLGVGLTLARQLARLHGGEVTASSGGKGQGSAFAVTLPVAPEVEGPADEVTGPRPPVARLRIAIVEDSADIRETLESLLEMDGHEVFTAADGPSGLRVILETQPDVALVDVGLPRMDGYELARNIRSSCGDGIRLVALTGYGREEDRKAAADAGFDRHLVKPVEDSVLTRLLAEVKAAKHGSPDGA